MPKREVVDAGITTTTFQKQRFFKVFVLFLFLFEVWLFLTIEISFVPPPPPPTTTTKVKLLVANDTTITCTISNNNKKILPKKVYTVVGKESSGTKFVSSMIRDALQLRSYREGARPYGFFPKWGSKEEDEQEPIQVQHFSLPQGSTCRNETVRRRRRRRPPTIIDVVFPSQCSSSSSRQHIQSIQNHPRFHYHYRKELPHLSPHSSPRRTQSIQKHKRFHYRKELHQQHQQLSLQSSPLRTQSIQNQNMNRYFLNLTSHKQWYDAHGTEQYYIIVVRNKEYSFRSRIKRHCTNLDIARMEESIATGIMNDAIRTFLLMEEQPSWNYHHNSRFTAAANDTTTTGGKFVTFPNSDGLVNDTTTTTTTIWTEQELLWDSEQQLKNDGNDILTSSLIPSKNNVVLVSYEKLMQLQDDYVKELYQILGIESDHIPIFRNGNSKYEKKLD